jgi:tetratricopeptide (TPR) repeat protein
MRQVHTPTCLISFFRRVFQRGKSENGNAQSKMSRYLANFALVALSFASSGFVPVLLAQQTKTSTSPAARPGLSPDKAISLAEQGHCRETISVLKRVMTSQVPAEIRKNAGIVGLRCSLSLDDRDSAVDFIRLLNKDFARDPDTLFILVHAYSDLSTRTAQDLGRTAPQSFAAHKLNAEALEMQGKWEPAQLEYEGMIAKEPDAPGIHFLLGRLLLSRPDAGPEARERAKREFLREVEIDPKNAGAEYILGELARQEEKWEEAVSRFSQAAKLDSNFAEAYLGWGASLVALKRYEEAVAPLQIAVRLQQGNPSAHFNLAVALSRSGKKEEAEKEYAIHRKLTQTPAPSEGKIQ